MNKPTPKKSVRAATAENGPWLPPPYEIADAAAIQECVAGTASKEQQHRAFRWVFEVCAGRYDMPYRPGAQEGERDTTFALGRQFVGQQIVKLTRLNISKLRSSDNAD